MDPTALKATSLYILPTTQANSSHHLHSLKQYQHVSIIIQPGCWRFTIAMISQIDRRSTPRKERRATASQPFEANVSAAAGCCRSLFVSGVSVKFSYTCFVCSQDHTRL